MKKIAVIGLGIIGGSLCGALTKVGYLVDGFDKNDASISYAMQMGYIKDKAIHLSQYDVVFIALPPYATMEYLDTAILVAVWSTPFAKTAIWSFRRSLPDAPPKALRR